MSEPLQQLDMICSQCPLADCDEDSLFCCFRWATNPNRAQRKMLGPYVEQRVAERLDEIARERNLAQLAEARKTQARKRSGRKNYEKTLKPFNDRRTKLNALGFGKYDGRKTRCTT